MNDIRPLFSLLCSWPPFLCFSLCYFLLFFSLLWTLTNHKASKNSSWKNCSDSSLNGIVPMILSKKHEKPEYSLLPVTTNLQQLEVFFVFFLNAIQARSQGNTTFSSSPVKLQSCFVRGGVTWFSGSLSYVSTNKYCPLFESLKLFAYLISCLGVWKKKCTWE